MNILKRLRLHKDKEAEKMAGVKRIDATPEEIARAIFDKVNVPVIKDGQRVAKKGSKKALQRRLRKQEEEEKEREREQENEGKTHQRRTP